MKPGRATGAGSYPRIYAVVRRIPSGRVATYGQVAALAGLAGRARQVGYALHDNELIGERSFRRTTRDRGKLCRAESRGEGQFPFHRIRRLGANFPAERRIPELRQRRQIQDRAFVRRHKIFLHQPFCFRRHIAGFRQQNMLEKFVVSRADRGGI